MEEGGGGWGETNEEDQRRMREGKILMKEMRGEGGREGFW